MPKKGAIDASKAVLGCNSTLFEVYIKIQPCYQRRRYKRKATPQPHLNRSMTFNSTPSLILKQHYLRLSNFELHFH